MSKDQVREFETYDELIEGVTTGRERRLVSKSLLGISRLGFGLKVAGTENIPPDGPHLLISNHLHNIDPMITIASFPRLMCFMGKKEVFTTPVLGNIAVWSGGFPVDRGAADRSSLKAALKILKMGVPVGLYPEGTRSTTKTLQEGHAGAGFIALQAKVPVLPSAITGTERLPGNGSKGELTAEVPNPDRGHRGTRVLYGKPFMLPETIDGKKTTSAQATEIMMLEIARLLPPDYRGMYAEILDNETERLAIPL